jgi:ABC-type transport system involved in multi-copper enzyme maturation permease subunit
MATRWGLGPVFQYESLLNARRWQVYAGRAVFVAALLAGMVVVWVARESLAFNPGAPPTTYQKMAKIGEGFFLALAGIQVSLVLLAGPAATAGAICMDRARGTLLHMMVTDLSDTEIVLGKLASRLAPVFGLIVCGLPVMSIASLLGGIEFGALVGTFAVSLALGVLGCVLALTFSVWASKIHEVILAVYCLLTIWLLALPLWSMVTGAAKTAPPPTWFTYLNPYALVLAPYTERPRTVTAADYAIFVGVVLTISLGCVIVSVALLRRTVIAREGRPGKPVRSLVPLLRPIFPTLAGPSLDGNPVLWREWHRNRPSRLMRRIWLIIMVTTWGLAAWGTYTIVKEGLAPGPNGVPFALLLQLLFGFLVLSTTAPTALSEERVRGTLDVLLTTPLSTSAIVMAKWWGVYRRVLILAVMGVYAGVLFATISPDPAERMTIPNTPRAIPLTGWDRLWAGLICVGDFLASGAVIVSLGLALAIWVRRVGRAITISVVVFVLTGVGIIILQEAVLRPLVYRSMTYDWGERNLWLIEVPMSISPIGGPIQAIDQLYRYATRPRTAVWTALGAVVCFKAIAAAGLLWLSIKTFDRCLGRMPEAPNLAARVKAKHRRRTARKRHPDRAADLIS